jgi:transposase
MTKLDTYGRKAEALYVKEGKSLVEIAAELKLSRKTLAKWKADGRWDEKRMEYVRTMEDVKGDIVEVVKILARKMRMHYQDPEKNPALTEAEESRFYRLLKSCNLIKEEDKHPDKGTFKERVERAMEMFV